MTYKTATIVTLLENDPITGVRYGEKEILIENDDEQKTKAQKQYDKYVKNRARNTAIFKNTRTTQK